MVSRSFLVISGIEQGMAGLCKPAGSGSQKRVPVATVAKNHSNFTLPVGKFLNACLYFKTNFLKVKNRTSLGK
jgi:hypothetical protein